MLPVVEPDGKRMFNHIIATTWFLMLISMMPAYFGMSGKFYLMGTWVAGMAMLIATKNFSLSKTVKDARTLLRTTVIYLPVLLILIVLDAKL